MCYYLFLSKYQQIYFFINILYFILKLCYIIQIENSKFLNLALILSKMFKICIRFQLNPFQYLSHNSIHFINFWKSKFQNLILTLTNTNINLMVLKNLILLQPWKEVSISEHSIILICCLVIEGNGRKLKHKLGICLFM